jgi:hypothetical protein
MNELIEKVKEAKKVLDDSQKELLYWCRNKGNYTLDKRYSVWVKYVEKEQRPYIGCSGSKILADLIDMWVDDVDMNRHEVVGYDWVIDGLLDKFKSSKGKIISILNKHKSIVRESRIDAILNDKDDSSVAIGSEMTIDSFHNLLKEELIVANLGTFTFDW